MIVLIQLLQFKIYFKDIKGFKDKWIYKYIMSNQNKRTKEQIEFSNIQTYFNTSRYLVLVNNAYLDKVITERDTIILRVNKCCIVCYDVDKDFTDYDYLYIGRLNNKKITLRTVLDWFKEEYVLVDFDKYFHCNHRFIEGIYKVDGVGSTFELMLGS